MTITKRIERLEKFNSENPYDHLQLITIAAVEPAMECEDPNDPTSPMRIRPTTAEPTQFFACCLSQKCPEHQHVQVQGETLSEFRGRIQRLHEDIKA